MTVNRRELVAFLAGLPLMLQSGGTVAAAPSEKAGLRARAAAKGLDYGCAVQFGLLQKDQALVAAIKNECSIVVPEFEMKWGSIEHVRGTRNYEQADGLVAFARANGLKVRGHTAAWANNLPPWAPDVLRSDEGARVFDSHLRDVFSHFKGQLAEWDVVNEAVQPRDRRPGGLRNSILFRAFGAGFIDKAFNVAAEIDSKALLFYNDAGLEYAGADIDMRRLSTLKLLERLKTSGVPVHGLGIESHLEAGGAAFDAKVFRTFLRDVADLGLKIRITELDINDRALDGDIATRDRAVADMARRYLDATLDEKAVSGVLTWGLTDRYTWLNMGEHRWRRADKQPNRCLPLDADLQRKPFWFALAAAFDGAPDRRR